ncbi:hypothetical protein OHV05_35195 (plasmid) [Kitasatospora sp. NBC_00070]|uniref:hypothetical protein n=1 Tax=Kitasatospora sp. NBC_00070 TaxID=2975962 RepID=UPI0032456554
MNTRRGLGARMRYLRTTKGGAPALREAGVTATPATIRAWANGKQTPRPATREAIDTAYWNLRAANVIANSGAFKRHLNRAGRGSRVEIHPVNQQPVDENRRRDLRVRSFQVRYVWDDAVDALTAGDTGKLEEIWDDIIADLDSDYGAYQYVSHVGLGA